MIRPVLRIVALLCVLTAAACAETLEGAARTLARKVLAQMSESEIAVVAFRSVAQVSSAESERARSAFERALRRNGTKPARTVEITLSISENLRQRLLIADFNRDGRQVVEMTGYRADPVLSAVHETLRKSLVWEQGQPFLDLVQDSDRMLVLNSGDVPAYVRRASGWDRADSKPMEGVVPSRDSRGRLVGSMDSFTASSAGGTCRGTWSAALELDCQQAGVAITLGGVDMRFTPGRNTLEAEGWPPFFSLASLTDGPRKIFLLAQMDGRTHVYDAGQKPLHASGEWGDDFVSPTAGCGAGRTILATSTSDRGAPDSITAYEFLDGNVVQASDSLDMPGPVTALWPAANGALAVIHNLSSGQYAAYTVTLDCGR